MIEIHTFKSYQRLSITDQRNPFWMAIKLEWLYKNEPYDVMDKDRMQFKFVNLKNVIKDYELKNSHCYLVKVYNLSDGMGFRLVGGSKVYEIK